MSTASEQGSREHRPSSRDQAISDSKQLGANIKQFLLKARGDDAKNYDFKLARGQMKIASLGHSIGFFIKCCLGGGVVTIHESYKNCGLWTALCLNIFLGFAVGYCMHMLCRSAQKMYGRLQIPMMSYPDLAEASLATGPWQGLRRYDKAFRYTVDCIIIVELFGACCVYQLLVARTLKQLVDGSAGVDDAVHTLRAYLLMIVPPCLLLGTITSLQNLAPFSLVSDVFTFTVIICTVYFGVNYSNKKPMDMPSIKNFSGAMELIGVCMFSLDGIGSVLTIENHMTNPHKIDFVLFGGMSIVVTMLMTIGFFGYWGFGEDATSPITINFPWDHFSIMLKVFMVLMIYITFAINFVIRFQVAWYYIKTAHNPDRYWLWERIYRAIFLVLIILSSFIVPNGTKLIGLIGCFCISIIGFIIPAVIELSLNWEDLGLLRWRFWKAFIIIIFGAVLCIAGTYSNGKKLIMEGFI